MRDFPRAHSGTNGWVGGHAREDRGDLLCRFALGAGHAGYHLARVGNADRGGGECRVDMHACHCALAPALGALHAQLQGRLPPSMRAISPARRATQLANPAQGTQPGAT